MNNVQQTGTISIGDSAPVLLPWRLDGETLHLTVDGTSFRLASDGDLRSQVSRFLDGLSRSRDVPVAVQCCMTCAHFQMSGMALDMGRGQRGVCLKHKAGAEIMQSCDGHSTVVQ